MYMVPSVHGIMESVISFFMVVGFYVIFIRVMDKFNLDCVGNSLMVLP